MAKKLLLSFICVVFLLSRSFEQTSSNSVSGVIRDAGKNSPVAFASVMLLNVKDSVLVKGAVTDSTGSFNIENIADGNYLLAATFLGMAKSYTKQFSLSNNQKYSVGTILLYASSNNLNEVDVSAQKPLFEQKPGMTVVNVGANATNIGNSALDVLKKSPGVLVDNNNNISLKGKPGVTILIDDKPTYLSATDLANMLKNLPATSIDQIEIMTVPSAKYDAAGSAGIINIKLKKNIAFGLNGSIMAGYSQSDYAGFISSLNLNYRTAKFNFFGNYSINDYTSYTNNNIIRKFSDSGKITSIFDQNPSLKFPGVSNNLKAGVDYYLDKNNTIGVMVNGMFNNEHDVIFDGTTIFNPDYTVQSTSSSYNYYLSNTNNVTYDINFKSKLDTSGSEISGNVDYGRFNSIAYQSFLTNYYNSSGESVYPSSITSGNLPSSLNIYSAKIDFEHPFKDGIKLEVGGKVSYVSADNNVQYLNFENNEWVNDTGASNHFKYTENINAAYVDLSKDLKKGWSVEAGLRGEQTVDRGNQLTTDSSFARNYFQLFPTLFIKKDIDKNNELTLSYARRIDRPNYQDLNPFRYYVDPYTYVEGNPYLLPQITNDIELSYTYKNLLTTTVSVSQTTDVISIVLDQIDSTNTTIQTNDNLSILNNAGISETAVIPITKWWVSNNFINVFYNQYKGNYLNGNLNLSMVSWTGNTDNEFTLSKTFSIDLSAEYDGPYVYGIIVANRSGFVSVGLKKSLFNGHLDVKLNANDIFYTSNFEGSINYQNIDTHIIDKYDSRFAILTLTYHFGNNNAKGNHSTGIEDEKKRAKQARGT